MSVLPTLGTFYIKNYNGIAWTQPGGPNTVVYPQQDNGPFTAYPVPGQFFAESGQALWRGPCGHGWDSFQIWFDYDDSTHMSVAIVACPICSITLNYIEPASRAYDVMQFPIIVG